MKKFNKDMTIGQAIELNKKAEIVLSGFGMHCFSCAFSQMETLEEAAQVHDVDLDYMLQKLNELQTFKPQKPIKVSKKNKK